jgi:hypothetical protein
MPALKIHAAPTCTARAHQWKGQSFQFGEEDKQTSHWNLQTGVGVGRRIIDAYPGGWEKDEEGENSLKGKDVMAKTKRDQDLRREREQVTLRA